MKSLINDICNLCWKEKDRKKDRPKEREKKNKCVLKWFVNIFERTLTWTFQFCIIRVVYESFINILVEEIVARNWEN